jgi:hypothetical protein
VSRENSTHSTRWFFLALSVLGFVAVALRARGLNLSLWQDEAWVANSILEPTIAGMFYYDAWLQTSPPLFLIEARGVVALLGLANWTLKLVPFLSGLAACAALIYLFVRLFPGRRTLVVLLGALVVTSPSAAYFSHVLKQYSGELLAASLLLSALLLWNRKPSPRRFLLLLGLTLAGLCLAYGLVLLLPAVLLAVFPPFRRWWTGANAQPGDWARWILLTASAASVVALEYFLLVVPNSDPLLDGFWKTPIKGGLVLWATHAYSSVFILLSHLPLPTPVLQFTGARILAAVCTLLIIPAILLRTRRGGWRRSPAELMALVSLVTVLLSIISGLARIYPLVIRTSLIHLSCVLVLVGYAIALVDEEYFERSGSSFMRLGRPVLALSLAVLFGVGLQNRYDTSILAEDVDGAVAHLRDNSQPDEHIYVHSSAVEGFKLYRRIFDWTPPETVLGRVGAPCCPRLDGAPVSPDEPLLRADLNRALPARRLWVIHSDPKGIQWKNPGENYPKLTAPILAAAGCTEEASETLRGMAVRLFVCGTGR